MPSAQVTLENRFIRSVLLFSLSRNLWVPRHAVEALHVDLSVTRNGMNGALLVLSPLANWQILVGKLRCCGALGDMGYLVNDSAVCTFKLYRWFWEFQN